MEFWWWYLFNYVVHGLQNVRLEIEFFTGGWWDFWARQCLKMLARESKDQNFWQPSKRFEFFFPCSMKYNLPQCSLPFLYIRNVQFGSFILSFVLGVPMTAIWHMIWVYDYSFPCKSRIYAWCGLSNWLDFSMLASHKLF